jgi:hypothetical protein
MKEQPTGYRVYEWIYVALLGTGATVCLEIHVQAVCDTTYSNEPLLYISGIRIQLLVILINVMQLQSNEIAIHIS